MVTRALITGITGQDGSYLAELLLSKGYEVHGLIRRSSTFNTSRIDHLARSPRDPGARLHLHHGDLSDTGQLASLIADARPEEVYHLAGQSHVGVSFEIPEYTTEVIAMGTVRLLDAIRRTSVPCRYYQASSSEMFGAAPAPLNEESPFRPRSPYAVAKVHAYWTAVNYRQAHGLHTVNGILFNHESPRRGEAFVTRKITLGAARIRAGKEKLLHLGNLDARRDWGYAPEYVECIERMLKLDAPGDYVVGTGATHSVRELAEEAFAYAGLDWREHVRVDPRYVRPSEAESLVADSARARRELSWEPRISFRDLIRIMVDADLRLLGIDPPGDGERVVRQTFPERWWREP